MFLRDVFVASTIRFWVVIFVLSPISAFTVESTSLVAQEPEKAGLLIRICLAVSEVENWVPAQEQEQIAELCDHLGVEQNICPAHGSDA